MKKLLWGCCLALLGLLTPGLTAGEAPKATVEVTVTTPPPMAAVRVRPIFIESQAAVDQYASNMRALTPYAVIPAAMLEREEAAQKARAARDKMISPKLTLPPDIHRPAAAPAAEPAATVMPREFSGALPPGKYDLGLKIGDAGLWWWPDQNITAGAVIKGLEIEPLGAVRVTWTIDRPLHPEPTVGLAEPADLAELLDRLHRVSMVGLLRDGRVWAAGERISDREFRMPTVPPGEYTLVLHHVYERFLAVEPKVVVTSGEETTVTLKARRADQGGIGITYYDPTQNKYEPIHRWGRLYDPKLGLTFPVTASIHKTEARAGGLPQDYTVAQYGGLPITGSYRLESDEPRFRPVSLAVGASRLPPQANRPAHGAVGQPAEVAAEDYKPTIVRLQPLSAIAGKGQVDRHIPITYEMLPPRP